GGYKAHRDRHDVAIVLLSGRLEADGKTVEPFDLLYHSAGTLHGLHNAGDAPARYLVFEFERPGGGPDPETGKSARGRKEGRRERRRRRSGWNKLLPRWAIRLIRSRKA